MVDAVEDELDNEDEEVEMHQDLDNISQQKNKPKHIVWLFLCVFSFHYI